MIYRSNFDHDSDPFMSNTDLWPLEDIIRMFSQSQLKVNKATPQDSIQDSHVLGTRLYEPRFKIFEKASL